MMQDDAPKTRIKHRKLEPVIVETKDQILSVVSRFMPHSDTTIRKLLMTGLQEIKSRMQYLQTQNEIASNTDFGGFPPVQLHIDSMHWVDRLIKEQLCASRNGLLIVWTLKDGKHVFDPFTGDIKWGQ